MRPLGGGWLVTQGSEVNVEKEEWRGKGVEGLSRQPNDLCWGGGEARCSWQAVIFSVYPIVNVPWSAVCDGGVGVGDGGDAMLN